MDARQQAAINGAASAPLSKKQKRILCMLAERAWNAKGCPLWEPRQDSAIRLCRTSALELWRHMEQEHLLGRKHLTACCQADYELLRAHFARLAGDHREAAAAEARMSGDDARRAKAFAQRTCCSCPPIAARGAMSRRLPLNTKPTSSLSMQADDHFFDLRRAVWARKNQPKPEPLFENGHMRDIRLQNRF